MHTVLDHSCPRLAGLRHHTIEDQLHPVRPTQIQVVAYGFFEELTLDADLRSSFARASDFKKGFECVLVGLSLEDLARWLRI